LIWGVPFEFDIVTAIFIESNRILYSYGQIRWESTVWLWLNGLYVKVSIAVNCTKLDPRSGKKHKLGQTWVISKVAKTKITHTSAPKHTTLDRFLLHYFFHDTWSTQPDFKSDNIIMERKYRLGIKNNSRI
jgi:hypothetical protein